MATGKFFKHWPTMLLGIVVAAILVSLCWFREISGVREGTLLAAVLVGFIIRMLQQPLRFVKKQLVKA